MSLIPNNVWFGTENDMRWVPAPLPNYTPAQVRWRAKDQYLNGGAGVRQSTASHKELSLSWPVQSQEDLAPLVSYLQQAGPYFYLDPLNAEANAVPAYWSMPGLVQDGPPLIPGVAPSYVPTVGGRTLGYPTTSAVYEVEGTPNPNDTIRNYITNPEFKTTSGTVEVRRNIFRNPPLHNNLLSGISFIGSGALDVSPAYDDVGKRTPKSIRVITSDVTNNSPGPRVSLGVSNPGTYLTPGNYASVSISARKSVGASIYGSLGIYFGTNAGWIFPQESKELAEGAGYVPFNLTVEIPSNATSFTVAFFITSGPPTFPGNNTLASGVTVLVNGPVCCVSSTAEDASRDASEYFDALSSPDPDLTPSWVSTAGNSESVLTGKKVSGFIDSGIISYASDKGIAIQRRGTNNYTNGYMGFSSSVKSGLIIGYREEPIDFDRYHNRTLVCISPAAYNDDPGSGEKRFAFSDLVSTYRAGVYSGARKTETRTVYYRYFGVFPPDYTGPWFDGDSDPFLYNGKIYVPSWAGTPHNSQSIATAYEGNADTRIRIPVPSGYTLHVGLHGSGPGISVGGVSAPAIPLTSTERTNLQYSTPGIATIQLLPGTHVISGIIAQVRPTGAEVPRGGFIPGMGHSQLVLDGDPTVTHYSVGIANAQTGIAADFVEVGAWL